MRPSLLGILLLVTACSAAQPGRTDGGANLDGGADLVCGVDCGTEGTYSFSADAGNCLPRHSITLASLADGGLSAGSSGFFTGCLTESWRAASDGGCEVEVWGSASCIISGEANGFTYHAAFSTCRDTAVIEFGENWLCGCCGTPVRYNATLQHN
jgi:hypothetical protein